MASSPFASLKEAATARPEIVPGIRFRLAWLEFKSLFSQLISEPVWSCEPATIGEWEAGMVSSARLEPIQRYLADKIPALPGPSGSEIPLPEFFGLMGRWHDEIWRGLEAEWGAPTVRNIAAQRVAPAQLSESFQYRAEVDALYTDLKSPPPSIIGTLVHGSLADGLVAEGFSDADVICVLRTPNTDGTGFWEAARWLYRLNRRLLAINPFMHHGPMLVFAREFAHATEAALPSAVFRNGCWLNGKIDQVAYHDGTFEAVLSLEGFADYFERHHQFVPDLRNAFDVLWWCSSMLFLPLLHEQVATGTSVYKRTCLAGKLPRFPPEMRETLARVSAIRLKLGQWISERRPPCDAIGDDKNPGLIAVGARKKLTIATGEIRALGLSDELMGAGRRLWEFVRDDAIRIGGVPLGVAAPGSTTPWAWLRPVTRWPRRLGHADYDQARAAFLERCDKRSEVRAVFEFGEVGCPGLSDLDFCVVLSDDFNGIPTELQVHNFNDDVAYAMDHDPLFVSVSMASRLAAFYPFFAVRQLSGEPLELPTSRQFPFEVQVAAITHLNLRKYPADLDWLLQQPNLNVRTLLAFLHSAQHVQAGLAKLGLPAEEKIRQAVDLDTELRRNFSAGKAVDATMVFAAVEACFGYCEPLCRALAGYWQDKIAQTTGSRAPMADAGIATTARVRGLFSLAAQVKCEYRGLFLVPALTQYLALKREFIAFEAARGREPSTYIEDPAAESPCETGLDQTSLRSIPGGAPKSPTDRKTKLPESSGGQTGRRPTRKKSTLQATHSATVSAPKSILFIRPDSYGDVILFEPVLRLLAEQWPETKIGLVAQAGRGDLAPLLPAHVRWFPLACNPHRVGSQAEPTLHALAMLKAQVDGFEPECVVAACYDKTWVEAAVAAMAPHARRVSVGPYVLAPIDAFDVEAAYGRPLASWFDEIVAVEESEPELDKHRKLLAHLTGKPAASFVPTVTTPDRDRAAARRHLSELGLAPGRYFVCCPAGNANVSIKSWPAKKYGELISRLAAKQGWAPLLTGHVSERPILDAVAAVASKAGCQSVRIWAGNDGEIGLLAGLISDARYYVGNDTGSMHLAAALGVRVVGVFGGGTWPRFRPAAPYAVCVVHPLPCFPCGWSCYFGDAPCLHRISVAEVEKAVQAVLQAAPGCHDQVVANAFSADEKDLIESIVRRQKSLFPAGGAAGQQTVPAARVRELLDAFRHSEQDRAARLAVIHQQGHAHSALESAHDAVLRELAEFKRHFAGVEADRAARLEVIEQQARKHSGLEGEHDARLKELNALYATAEALKNERDLLKLQLTELTTQFTSSEADRAARLEVIEQQARKHSELEAEHDARLKELTTLYATAEALRHERDFVKLQLAELQGHFHSSQADRAARLEVIEQQARKHSELEAEHDARLKELTALYATAEALRHERDFAKLQLAELQGHFHSSQADRAARLEVIEQQARKHSELEAEHDARLKELTALYATAEALRHERDFAKLQLAELQGHFHSSQADRAARLEVIEQQARKHSALEAEHDARLKELTALYATAEALRHERDFVKLQLAELQGHFNSSEADRAARLAVIERQGRAHSALEAEHDVRLKELTALYATAEALRNERNSAQAQLAELQRQLAAMTGQAAAQKSAGAL